MNKSDVVVGMKVVPFQKSVKGYCSFDECNMWREAKGKSQPFLYVQSYNAKADMCTLGYDYCPNTNTGNYYHAEDFEPYCEEVEVEESVKLKVVFEAAKPAELPEFPFVVRYETELTYLVGKDKDDKDEIYMTLISVTNTVDKPCVGNVYTIITAERLRKHIADGTAKVLKSEIKICE